MSGAAAQGTARSLFAATLGARKDIFVQAALASVLANLLALAASLYSMQVYDRVIPTQGLSTLTVLTIGVLLAIALEFVVKLCRSYLLESGIQQMDIELSVAIFARLLGIRLDQFPASVGTLSAQLRSYEMIRRFATSATLYLLVDTPFSLIFIVFIAVLAGPQMALLPLGFLGLALLIGLLYRRRIFAHARSGAAAANEKLGLLVESVDGAETIKASGAGPRLLQRWNGLSQRAAQDDTLVQRSSEHINYLGVLLQQMAYVLLVALGAWLTVSSSQMSMGALIACTILAGRALSPVAALPGLMLQWAHARVALQHLEKVFALQADNQGVARPLRPDALRGDWRLDNLAFDYPGHARAVVVSALRIGAGERVGILGPVGAGKSTLIRLLAGLYAPSQGRVLLDDLDLQQIDREWLSGSLAYLPQHARLLAGTLRDNLITGLAPASDTALLQAARLSGLDQLIAAHAQGLDMPIFEGGEGVSGGQRQLIHLTRLLLARPQAWLLDEPTAHMDEASEQRCITALRQSIGPAQTLILVTHKPVLLDLVDRLVVLLPGGGLLDGPKQAVLARLAGHATSAVRPEIDRKAA